MHFDGAVELEILRDTFPVLIITILHNKVIIFSTFNYITIIISY